MANVRTPLDEIAMYRLLIEQEERRIAEAYESIRRYAQTISELAEKESE